jgi:hypothetical protein
MRTWDYVLLSLVPAHRSSHVAGTHCRQSRPRTRPRANPAAMYMPRGAGMVIPRRRTPGIHRQRIADLRELAPWKASCLSNFQRSEHPRDVRKGEG